MLESCAGNVLSKGTRNAEESVFFLPSLGADTIGHANVWKVPVFARAGEVSWLPGGRFVQVEGPASPKYA